MILLLDLILLKPRVYLHLLFNSGVEPSKAADSVAQQIEAVPLSIISNDRHQVDKKQQQQQQLQVGTRSKVKDGNERKHTMWKDVIALGTCVILAETFTRFLSVHEPCHQSLIFNLASGSNLNSNSNSDSAHSDSIKSATSPSLETTDILKLLHTLSQILWAVVAELLAQHLVTLLLALTLLRIKGWYPYRSSLLVGSESQPEAGEKKQVVRAKGEGENEIHVNHSRDGRQENFRSVDRLDFALIDSSLHFFFPWNNPSLITILAIWLILTHYKYA